MNYRIWTVLTAIAFLLLITACESGAKFRVINSTSFSAYARVENGTQVTIPAGGAHEFEVDTDTQSIFSGEVSKTVKVWMIGETYSIYDTDISQFTDSTWVTLKAGKTLEAYLNPNRACVKVSNNSSQNIVSAVIWQHGAVNHLQMGTFNNLAPGQSRFLRVPYVTQTTTFNYEVVIATEDGGNYSFGDSGTVLAKDQQFHVVFTDPVNK